MDASYSEILDEECLQFHFDPEDTNLTLQQVLAECERFNQESEHRGVVENGRGSPFGGRLTPMEYFPCNGGITPSGYLSPLFGTPCASGRASPFVGGVGGGATSTSGGTTLASPLPPRKQITADNGRTDKCWHALASEARNDEKTGKWSSDEESVNQEEVLRRLDSGLDLYPNCDVTIWLRSCHEEVVEPLQGQVIGSIPSWLSGSLIRNGPGSLEVGDMSFDHLFDSSALLHRFAIHEGKVTYQNRFLRSETYKRNQAAQRIVVTEFGTKAVPDPCQSIFQRVSALFHPGEAMSDNAMISVYPFGDEFYTFTEAPVIHRIDPKTLETLKRVNVSEHVGIVNHTSHPHVMADATVYNMGMTVSATGPSYTIIEFPPPALTAEQGGSTKLVSPFDQARVLGSVRARWPLHPAYMHTFGITDNFFVVVEQPLSVSVPHMLKSQLRNDPMAASLRWYQDKQTLIHLLQRKNGKLFKTFHAEAFFYLHIINQYEESDHLVIDICCYKDAAMLDCMYIDSLKGAQHNPDYARMFRGRPLRFVLPLAPPPCQGRDDNLVTLSGTLATASRSSNGHVTVTPELICDLGCETPRINYELHLGKKYRYFYAISSDVDMENPGTLIKVDIKTKTRQTWCEENVFPSEPIFVATPDPKSEDDGVILAALVWGQGMDNQAGLLVLDARSWTELGRARFTTPSAVPKCLHGWFTASVH